MPGIAFDDWGELQTVPHVLGVAHPTGYPVYILSAWLFELLPIGSVAFRANMFSAVCGRGAGHYDVDHPPPRRPSPDRRGSVGGDRGDRQGLGVGGGRRGEPAPPRFIALIVDRALAWADLRRRATSPSAGC